VSKGVRIRGYFSNLKGVREEKVWETLPLTFSAGVEHLGIILVTLLHPFAAWRMLGVLSPLLLHVFGSQWLLGMRRRPGQTYGANTDTVRNFIIHFLLDSFTPVVCTFRAKVVQASSELVCIWSGDSEVAPVACIRDYSTVTTQRCFYYLCS
jgi:hypothetical protein